MLHQFNIPFRYDARVRIQGSDHLWKTYYVDFVVMTPNEKEILWEHFGLMGNEEFDIAAVQRLIEGQLVPLFAK